MNRSMSLVSLVLAIFGLLLIFVGAKALVDRQKSEATSSQGAPSLTVPGICLVGGIGLIAFAIWNIAAPVF
jgi:hypothetical protein